MRRWMFAALGLLGAFVLGQPARAQQQQCISNALAGGTVNAIKIPLLPCALSTNLLILTASGTNTGAVTLQMSGYPAMPVQTSTGSALSANTIPSAGAVVLLTSTGSAWKIVSGNSSAVGCTTSGSAGQVLTDSGAGGCTSHSDMTFATGTLSLGTNTSEAGVVKLFGGTSGNLSLKVATVAGTNSVLTWPGATFDFSASGGTSQVVKQTASGGGFSVAQLACGDLSNAGTACQAATGTSGATVPLLNAANTWNGKQTFNGTSANEAIAAVNIAEPATVAATAATGTINYDLTSQSIIYYTSNASANWTVNFRGSSGTSLNTLMATGDILTATFAVTQGASPFFNNVYQVDGTTSGVTVKWQGGTAPSAGNASGVDIYTYAIVKTGSAAYTIFASQIQYK